MARRNALSGNLAHRVAIKAVVDLVETGVGPLKQIVGARLLQQAAALVQIISSGFSTDRRLAAVQKGAPRVARHALPADLAAQTALRSMLLEPFDQLCTLAVADERPIDVADKADINVAVSCGRREVLVRIEGVRHLDDAAGATFPIEIARRGNRQLAAEGLAF